MNKLMLNLDTWLCIDLNVNTSSAVLLMFFLIEVWFIYNAVLIFSVQECDLLLHVYTYICIYVCDTFFFIFWFFNTVFLISLRGQHHDTKLYMCLFLKQHYWITHTNPVALAALREIDSPKCGLTWEHPCICEIRHAFQIWYFTHHQKVVSKSRDIEIWRWNVAFLSPCQSCQIFVSLTL